MSGLTRRGVLQAGLAGLTALVLGQQVFAEEDKLQEVIKALKVYVHAEYETRLGNRLSVETEAGALESVFKKHGLESELQAILNQQRSIRLTDFFKQQGYAFWQVLGSGYSLQKETGSARVKRKLFGEEHSFTLASLEEPELMSYSDYCAVKKTGKYGAVSWTISRDLVEFMPSVLEKEAQTWQRSFHKDYELVKGKLEMPIDINDPNFYVRLFTKVNCMAVGKIYESGDFVKKLTQKFREGVEIREGMHAFDHFELPERSDKAAEKAANLEVRAMLADIRHGDALLALGRCISYRHNDDGTAQSDASKIVSDGIANYAATHRDEFAIDYAEFDTSKNNLHLLKQVHKFTPEALQKAAQSVFETRYQGKTLARWLSN